MNDNVSSIIESTLGWFNSMGCQTAFAPDISPDSQSCDQNNFNSRIAG
jgi:hypothetical protein